MDHGPSTPYEDDAPPPAGWGSPPPTSEGQWDAPPGPAGGYPPHGYPAPAPAPPGYPGVYGQPAPPAGWTSSDDRTWATMAHLSYFVLSIIGPLIIMLTKGKQSPYVRDQAVEALNFHITFLIAVVVSFILVLVIVGFVLLPVVIICGLVFTIMAAIAANRGERYRYPVNIRFVH